MQILLPLIFSALPFVLVVQAAPYNTSSPLAARDCVENGSSCQNRLDCCSNYCSQYECYDNPNPGGPSCYGFHMSCGVDQDCCEGHCIGHECLPYVNNEPPQCYPVGAKCDVTSNCCSGLICSDSECYERPKAPERPFPPDESITRPIDKPLPTRTITFHSIPDIATLFTTMSKPHVYEPPIPLSGHSKKASLTETISIPTFIGD